MKTRLMLAALILAAPAIPGCGARSEVHAVSGRTVSYRCGDLSVTANFHANGGVELGFGKTLLSLPQVVAASGARYADDQGNEFWTKGTASRFTEAGQPARDCSEAADGA